MFISIFIRELDGGGAQRDAILLANALAARGSATSILTLRPEGRFANLVSPDVQVVAIGARKLRSAVPSLRQALKALKPRYLLSSEAAANIVAFIAARSLPRSLRPSILLREVTSPSVARYQDPYLQNRLAYRFIRWVYSNANVVLTLTEGAKADLVSNFCVPEGRIAVLRSNAVLTPETERHLAASAALSKSQREPGLIVSVGRLSPEKDQLLLLEAMARLRVHSPIRLLLIGDGMLREKLEKRAAELHIADRVSFAGYVEDPFAWLMRAEVAVCSSRFEGFGNAIVEALACGTPVISTDCPWGPREILSDGHYGTLVPVGDVDALARAIGEQIGAPVNRNSLRVRAAAFTSGAAATAFLDVLSLYGLEPAPAAR